MADPTVSELMARLDRLENEKKALETKAAEGESFQRKLTELQQQTHAEKVTAHRAKLMEAFEAPIKDRKILPAVREQFKRVYKTETDDVLNVTVADAEVFMRANPNPDAPRSPHTAGGVDSNDPIERSIAAINKEAAESFARGSAKTADQAYIDSVKAGFRRDPQLAQAWRDAPGYVNR